MKRLLFLNSLSGAGALVVLTATAFVMTPIIVRELGNHDYGVWEVIVGVVGYLGILDLGIGPSLIRLFAHARARGELEEIERIFNTALAVLVAISLLALVALVMMATAPERFFGIEPGAIPQLGLVFAILGVSLLAKFPGAILIAYLQGVQRHYLMNGLHSAVTLVQAVLVYVALTEWEGPKLVWLALIELGMTLCEQGIYAGLLLFRESALRISPSRFSLTTLRRLYSFGSRTLLASMSARLRNQAMPLIIAHVVGIERVVFFVITQRVTEYALLLGGSLGRPLTAYFSDLHGREDTERIRSDWFRANRFLQFIVCGLAVGIAFLGADFIACWMGPEYGRESRIIVQWLALGLFCEGLAPAAIQVLVGMDKHGRAGLALLSGAVMSVALSLPLGDRFGLEGIAAAYALGMSGSAFVTMIFACRAIEVPVLRHFREGLLVLAPALMVEALILAVFRQRLGGPTDYASLLWQGLFAGAAYTCAWWLVTLRDSERDLLREVTIGQLRRTP